MAEGPGFDLSFDAILDDEALPFSGASQLRFDRQDNGIEVRLLSQSPCLQRRGDLRPAQPDFDPIGRDERARGRSVESAESDRAEA